MQPLTSRVGLGAGRGLHAVPLLGRRQLWLPCSSADPSSPRSLRVNGRKGTGGIEIFFQAAPLIFRHLSNLGKIHLGFYCKPQRLMLTGCFRAASNTFQKVSVKLSGGWVLHHLLRISVLAGFLHPYPSLFPCAGALRQTCCCQVSLSRLSTRHGQEGLRSWVFRWGAGL